MVLRVWSYPWIVLYYRGAHQKKWDSGTLGRAAGRVVDSGASAGKSRIRLKFVKVSGALIFNLLEDSPRL